MSKEQKNKCDGTAPPGSCSSSPGVGTGPLLQELEAQTQTCCTPQDERCHQADSTDQAEPTRPIHSTIYFNNVTAVTNLGLAVSLP